MDIQVEFKGLTVSREHIRQLAALNLDAALPVGYKPVSEDLEITSQSTSETSGKLGLSIHAARKIEPVVDLTQVAKAVLGLRPTDASVRLKTLYQLDELPVVQLTPAWWPRLPVLAFQVAVSD
jgi:hypothetical protein